jgi:chromate reductase, NAD(P)H dehydrogenase (quinone)
MAVGAARADQDGLMRLLAISGSLRRGSYNSALLDAAAADCLPNVEFVVWRGLADVPAYSEDLDVVPPAVAALRGEIARSDGVLIATPEYNHSVPGALKNALDWASRPFPDNQLRGKPVAVVGASTGLFGAVWAQAELRKVLMAIGANVLPAELPVASAETAFTTDGRLREPRLAAALRQIVYELLEHTARRAA